MPSPYDAVIDLAIKQGLIVLAAVVVITFLSTKLRAFNRRQRQKKRTGRTWQRSSNRPTYEPLTEPLAPLSALKVSGRRPLTRFEERMYFTLAEALPECIILAQVSFSMLMDTKNQADRNRFDRKTADFVICSRQLTPIAVIELDDPSHLLTAERDADRDALMATAGYTTLRYTAIPDVARVRTDIELVLAGITGNAATAQQREQSAGPY